MTARAGGVVLRGLRDRSGAIALRNAPRRCALAQPERSRGCAASLNLLSATAQAGSLLAVYYEFSVRPMRSGFSSFDPRLSPDSSGPAFVARLLLPRPFSERRGIGSNPSHSVRLEIYTSQ